MPWFLGLFLASSHSISPLGLEALEIGTHSVFVEWTQWDKQKANEKENIVGINKRRKYPKPLQINNENRAWKKSELHGLADYYKMLMRSVEQSEIIHKQAKLIYNFPQNITIILGEYIRNECLEAVGIQVIKGDPLCQSSLLLDKQIKAVSHR